MTDLPASPSPTPPEIDTTNWALIASSGEGITVIRPARLAHMTKEQALVAAAYIVCIIGDDDLWQRVREAVESV